MEIDQQTIMAKMECLQSGLAQIAQRFQKLLREDQEEITNTNSQLRFSMSYKSLARILHLARGQEEGGVVSKDDKIGMHDGKRVKALDFLLDDNVKSSNAYETLKNQCMLGAVLKYTERSKQRLSNERNMTMIALQWLTPAPALLPKKATSEKNLSR